MAQNGLTSKGNPSYRRSNAHPTFASRKKVRKRKLKPGLTSNFNELKS